MNKVGSLVNSTPASTSCLTLHFITQASGLGTGQSLNGGRRRVFATPESV